MSLISELYRRFCFSWRKPRHWKLRPKTIDRKIFKAVVLDNEYGLPEQFDSEDVIVDVGAHTGSFTYAAVGRHARHVYCFEPDHANYELLCQNLKPYGGRVHLRNAAVWRSDQPLPTLCLQNTVGQKNTGAGCIGGVGQAVTACRFDDVIAEITQRHARPIRLLKLDCEGSEWPILLTSQKLDQVESLCGEYHLGPMSELYAVEGYPDFSPEVLEAFLISKGYSVALRPNREYPNYGLFFATKPVLSRVSTSVAMS